MRLMDFVGRRVFRILSTGMIFVVIMSVCGVAFAGEVSTEFFTIEVESSLGYESWSVSSNDVNYDPVSGTWTWAGSGISLGEVATLDQANLTVIGDPQIAMGFAMTAGMADTTVTITSAALSFSPLVNPDGAATSGITLTQTGGSATATLTGLAGANGSAYAACYNVPTPGTVFAEFIPGLTTATTISDNANTGGWNMIADTVSSMQSQFSFTLSAGDQASGTSNYLIVPEPACITLLAMAGSLLLYRRR